MRRVHLLGGGGSRTLIRFMWPLGLIGLLVLGGLAPPAAFSTAEAADATEATPAAGVDARLRQGSGPLPAGCSLPAVTATMLAFVDAFNRGDQAALARFFPAKARTGLPLGNPTPDAVTGEYPFEWYSVAGPPGGFNPGFAAHDRAELLAYFAARHAQHERIRLLRLEVSDTRAGDAGMLFDVERSADDIPTYVAGAKGEMNCPARTIYVVGMGERPVLTYFTAGPDATPGFG